MSLKDLQKPTSKGLLKPRKKAKKKTSLDANPIQLRMTQEQYDKLEKEADNAGYTALATFIRFILKKHNYI